MTRFALAIVLAVIGCSGTPKGTGPKPDPVAKADDPTCPVLVAGTSVTVEDLDQGAAFVFVTTGDAAAVRTRAAALVAAHNEHHGAMSGHAGHEMKMPEGKHAMKMGHMIGVHSTATVAEIEHGARVEFTAAAPADVAKLQSELRMHAQHLGTGTCEM